MQYKPSRKSDKINPSSGLRVKKKKRKKCQKEKKEKEILFFFSLHFFNFLTSVPNKRNGILKFVPCPFSSSLTSISSLSDRGILCFACLEGFLDLPYCARPRNFSLVLKKSMLSVLLLDNPSALPWLTKALPVCNLLGLLLSLLWVKERTRGWADRFVGLRGLRLLLVKSGNDRLLTSKSVVPKLGKGTSSELLCSGKFRDNSTGLALSVWDPGEHAGV